MQLLVGTLIRSDTVIGPENEVPDTNIELRASYFDTERWSKARLADTFKIPGQIDPKRLMLGYEHDTVVNDAAAVWIGSALGTDGGDVPAGYPLLFAHYPVDACQGTIGPPESVAPEPLNELAASRPHNAEAVYGDCALDKDRALALNTSQAEVSILFAPPELFHAEHRIERSSGDQKFVPVDTFFVKDRRRTLFGAFEPFPSEQVGPWRAAPSPSWHFGDYVLCLDNPSLPEPAIESLPQDVKTAALASSIFAVKLQLSPKVRFSSFSHP